MTSNTPLSPTLGQLSRPEKERLLARLLQAKAQPAAPHQTPQDGPPFRRDARLDARLQPCAPALPVADPTAILLTGATGFLGAHLLYDLCRLTQATLYCLVRAAQPAQALQRVQENLARYVDYVPPAGRLVPVVGDLARPLLGLSPTAFAELAAKIDVIYHNGAVLNHLATYERLKPANVLSTIELLKLASHTRPKWVHYISSLVAAVDRDQHGTILEHWPTADPSEIAGGYAQSKWVSEKLLAEAHARGFGVTLFRPGFISGRRDTGAWAVAHDHLLLLLKGCLQMGYAPESALVLDLTPVDFVSEAVVKLSLAPPDHPVVHLSNPSPLSWTTLLTWIQHCGYPLQVVPGQVWRETHLLHIDHHNALLPILPLYLENATLGQRELLIAKLSNVSRAYTLPRLDALALHYPSMDRTLWNRYVRFFQHCGFLPPPDVEERR